LENVTAGGICCKTNGPERNHASKSSLLVTGKFNIPKWNFQNGILVPDFAQIPETIKL